MGSFFSTSSEPTFKKIEDRFTTLSDLYRGLDKVGLESCNLIIGVDFTGSNYRQGKISCSGRSLHHVETGYTNPYQEVIFLIGRTLSRFDDDGWIPAYAFGDLASANETVTPFYSDGRDCKGFQEVLQRYTELVPLLQLSGPTSFAPLIYAAVQTVKETRKYHILLVVTDGEVSDPKKDAEAIIYASGFPLSIVVIGVGDGPWENMERFDDELPERKFDNFQFVPFHSTMNYAENPDNTFAVAALQEIPDQYRCIKELGLLSNL
jgi:E3 ubiquitin-protein ligase RGLG